MAGSFLQLTARPEAPAQMVVAEMVEETRDTAAPVEALVSASLQAGHHAPNPRDALAELRSPDLPPEEKVTTAAACRLINALGKAAQPPRIDVSQLWTATGHNDDEQQGHLLCMAGLTNRKFQHINWFGKAVFNKTVTSPAVSLSVIAMSPKKECFDFEINLCTSVLLHNARRLVDPILYTGDFELLNRYSGTKLENAVIGSCYKFYIDRGRWPSDDWKADEDIPVLDTMAVNDYRTDDTILNGWFNTRNVPVRSDFISYPASFAKRYHAARKPAMEQIARSNGDVLEERFMRWPFVKSLLHQVVHCSEIEDIHFRATSQKRYVLPEAMNSKRATVSERLEALYNTRSPELAKIEAVTEAIVCCETGIAFDSTSDLEPEPHCWEEASDTASRVYFGQASGSSADSNDTSLETQSPALSSTRQTGAGERLLTAERPSEACINDPAHGARSASYEGQQQESEVLTATTLVLDCSFAAEFDIPGLVEPRLPLPKFKRSRLPARQASWAAFRGKMRKLRISSSVTEKDKWKLGTRHRVNIIVRGLLRRKQDVLR